MMAHFLATAIYNQRRTLDHSLRVLKDMPGRKILNMLAPFGVVSLQETADEALRAGVVINFLDIEGLQNFYANASVWQAASFNSGAYTQEMLEQKLQAKPLLPPVGMVSPSLFSAPNMFVGGDWRPNPLRHPLPALTGGLSIVNSNFFLDGVGRDVEGIMRGYYLVSYEPPPNTFEAGDAFRSLRVRVNRRGATVHTRSGFFGRLESNIEIPPKEHPLNEALYSPFQATDLNVNIAAGYVHDAEAGYIVRSWIHIDPRDMKFVEMQDGGARIEIEALCVTSDIKGDVHDSRRVYFTLSNIKTPEHLAWIQKHGIRFSMALPVKEPGPYYVRVSVQDKETGRIGSAYQFLEIPDLGKKGLTLSNIFMITSADDLNWLSSDVKKEIAAEGVFLPVFQGEEVRTPTLRMYKPGDNLQTLAMLYNANAGSISRSEIEMQSVLYKDGREYMRGKPVPIAMDGAAAPNNIPILQKMTIGSDMPPGDYVLQITVTDRRNSRRQEGNASQAISFTVVP